MKLRIIDDVEVHSSSGNVYADLGLADAEQLKIKTDLVIQTGRPQGYLTLGRYLLV